MIEWKRQAPVDGPAAATYADMYGIICHPAFRLGFLDAAQGKPPEHDEIVDRIYRETPMGALHRLGWYMPTDTLDWDHERAHRTQVAQYRYEEGRLLFIQEGVRCKAWGHPDHPPVGVRRWCRERAEEKSQKAVVTNQRRAA